MPRVIIDGIEYEVREGRNMLEAALDNGLDLPYFCWHPAMGSVGACRLCAVRIYKDENDTKGKIQMACMTPALEGTRMSINDPEAVEFRRYVIEWLMTNHPHDCPVCDEGGECHLQDMTTMCGHVYRRFRFKKRTYKNQYLGPFVTHEMNRCIQCYRCVRFYRDLAGGRDFNYFGSRNRIYFGRDRDGVLESEFSGNLVEVCPTGVFTDKTYYRHYTRKWDLETAPSVCIHCGLGCNTIPGARYGMLRRVTARFNGDVNGYFLCDRGRFGYEFNNCSTRLSIDEQGLAHALDKARNMLTEADGVVGIGSPRASLEANYALQKLVGPENYSTGLSDFEQAGISVALEVLRKGSVRTPSLSEVELSDVVLILGIDPTNEAPMLDFAIRQAMRKAPLDIARKLKIPEWDANAVATALQSAKGKLYIAAPWRLKIAEIALQDALLSPEEIIKLATETDRLIRQPAETSSEGLTSRIAADLIEARRPLIATGVSAGPDVIKAAANLAQTLVESGKDCGLFITVPEANSMGVGMLSGMSAEDALRRIESGEADTLIVLENDLYRRVRSAEIDIALTKARNIIVLDYINTQTAERANVVLPIASHFESNGTFINNEGRAQRFFQVFVPDRKLLQSWQAIQELKGESQWNSFEDVLRELAADKPEFAPALEAAADSTWRSKAGQKVARMSHRYSGRTAKNAHIDIKEPEQPEDLQTALAFTMEGTQNPPDSSLVPRFWWPGWNSENAINKFQIEVGGSLQSGNPGKRLIEPSGERSKPFEITEQEKPDENLVRIVPRAYIFGSEELSRLAPGIAELTPKAELIIHPDLAASLGLGDHDEVRFEINGETYNLTAKLDESVAPDTVCVPAGYPETKGITGLTHSRLIKV